MNTTKLKLSDIPQFSDRDIAYINEIDALRPFYKYEVNLASFDKAISDKKNDPIDRKLIASVLRDQYAGIDTSDLVKKNVNLLEKENTYTIITAHQPSLMTGPGYYFYKIFSVLNLVSQLRSSYPNYHFVPIFITGGEDHDFEEVNHFTLYNKELTWESDQKGSVGQFSLDEGFEEMFEMFMDVLGDSENIQELKASLIKTKSQAQNYSGFAIGLTNLLFQDTGLVVVDMSDPRFKKAFIPSIKKEIFEQPSATLVESAQQALTKINLKPQAFARPINFFYTGTGDRLRIEQSGDHFHVIDSDIQFSKAELEEEIDAHPEYFSPNVVMRPVYQESILPNLAYIGGGGEIAYWLERKTQFESFGINFPMLIRRNSGMVIDKGSQKKMNKLGLGLSDIFDHSDTIISKYLDTVNGDILEFDKELSVISDVFSAIASRAKEVDPSLEAKMLAEGKKMTKQVEQLTSRVKRAAKQKEETAVNQIGNIKEKLFPNLGLQERKVSFLEIILKNGIAVIPELIPAFDPLEKTMIVIEE